MDKLDFIKIENVFPSKNIIKKMKIQATDWQKMFSNHISDKGLDFRIYKNSYNTIIGRQPTQSKNGQRT